MDTHNDHPLSPRIARPVHRWIRRAVIVSLTMAACLETSLFVNSLRAQETRGSDNNGKPGQDTPAAPAVTLVEGERVVADDVAILVRSTLLEEGDAVKKLNDASINNVRYNINGYPIGYALAIEKTKEGASFTGPLKAWRATGAGEVSRWPPVVYSVTRKETMRQAKQIEPIPLAEATDEMNQLRLYYLRILVGHEDGKYQEDPTAVAFFVHPKSGSRMTLIYRGGRSYASVNEPLVANAKVFVKEVAPGRGRDSLIPSVFYPKELTFEAEPFPKGDKFDRLMLAVMDTHSKSPLAKADFSALFEAMNQYTVDKAAKSETASSQRK